MVYFIIFCSLKMMFLQIDNLLLLSFMCMQKLWLTSRPSQGSALTRICSISFEPSSFIGLIEGYTEFALPVGTIIPDLDFLDLNFPDPNFPDLNFSHLVFWELNFSDLDFRDLDFSDLLKYPGSYCARSMM